MPRELRCKKHYTPTPARTTLFAINMSASLPIKADARATAVRFCVLGIDPSSAGATGYGVVEFLGSAPRMLRYGALKMRTREAFGARLREIHELISALIIEFSPDAMAVESVFTALNVGTTLRLAEVRGVVLLAAAQASIPALSYSPREVKASITGYGAASKQQIQQMVRATLGLSEYPEPEDAADALAIALCHAHAARAQQRMDLAMGKKAAGAAVDPRAALPRRSIPSLTNSSIRNRARIARIS
jgi:crossover junction endodeoxyribonuclease RuvC